MAKNDAILLDGIIEEKMSTELLDRGEAFELFAFEQILKSYDLTREEIDTGWVDGKDDGGIDGFFTFINGVLLQNTEGYLWPKKGATIDIWIISCKHRDSFKQEPLNTLFPTIEELLDFTKRPTDFVGQYSEALVKARQIAVQAFLRTAVGLPCLNFHFGYASRGDLAELGDNIEARGNQLKRIVTDYFSAASVSLDYFGATELIELSRKNRVVLELPYSEQLSGHQGAFVLLVPIDAYATFVSDEHGNLRRYLFDSNVRDFLGQNRVNVDISESLMDQKSPDFWWLNNGVTILATSAFPLGRTPAGNAIQLHDVQIVNGLQTTQTIYNYFKIDSANANRRCVLIKVIVSEDTEVRDKIIQATNNQSTVELAALNATDKIQRDIEQILERHNWYYERRRNYYKNIGKPVERFITPLLLAVALIALVKKAPRKAGTLKTKFMRNPVSYEAVFSHKVSIELWPQLAAIMKAVEAGMAQAMPRVQKSGERILGSWRGAVALCSVAKLHGTFNLDTKMIMTTDVDQITLDFVGAVFSSLRNVRDMGHGANGLNDVRPIRGGRNIDQICQLYGHTEGISDLEVIGKWMLPTGAPSNVKPSNSDKGKVDEAILARINVALPPQPWQPGVHRRVAEQLGEQSKVVYQATQQLIESGIRYRQRNGVVFDAKGNIVAVDPVRADPIFVVGEKYDETEGGR